MTLSLQKYVYWSLALHLGAFLTLMFSPSFPLKGQRFRQEKIVWVSIPKGTAEQFGTPMKRSLGLPKTTIQEQKKAMESPPAGERRPAMTYKPPQPEKKTVQPLRPPPPRRPGHPDSAIEKALSRVQKEVAMKRAEPEAGQIPETQPGGFTFGTTTGPTVSPDDPEYVLYQAKIRKRIMNEWVLPMKYADEALGLICQIVVHINERGTVVTKEWQKKSGNPAFDMSAMRAIEKASPLDIPPERLKYEVFTDGFLVEFKPSSSTKTSL